MHPGVPHWKIISALSVGAYEENVGGGVLTGNIVVTRLCLVLASNESAAGECPVGIGVKVDGTAITISGGVVGKCGVLS